MKHLVDEDTFDPQDSPMESSSKGSLIKRGSECFIKRSNLWNSWDDGMMTKEVKQIKGLKFLHSRKLLKEVWMT